MLVAAAAPGQEIMNNTLAAAAVLTLALVAGA